MKTYSSMQSDLKGIDKDLHIQIENLYSIDLRKQNVTNLIFGLKRSIVCFYKLLRLVETGNS